MRTGAVRTQLIKDTSRGDLPLRMVVLSVRANPKTPSICRIRQIRSSSLASETLRPTQFTVSLSEVCDESWLEMQGLNSKSCSSPSLLVGNLCEEMCRNPLLLGIVRAPTYASLELGCDWVELGLAEGSELIRFSLLRERLLGTNGVILCHSCPPVRG